MTEDGNVIMAIDAGTRHLGICVGYGGQYVTSWAGDFDGPDVSDRIAAVAEYMAQKLRRYDPDVIAIEEPMGDHGNRYVDRVLGRVCGAIEAALALTPRPEVEGSQGEERQLLWVNPTHVKGTGFSKDALQAVRNMVGKDDIGPDEADAIGVWLVAVGELQAQRFRNLTAPKEAE